MKKVITYGTFDNLHYGHINLLKRAKALGDSLTVGITSDTYDASRGKLLVTQSLSERIEAVKETHLADEITVEEYEGQKIEDIKRLGIDIFAIGSDWEGCFDYLKDYCEVVYLPRTDGISSTDIRNKSGILRLGIAGSFISREKFIREASLVSGMEAGRIWKETDTEEEYEKLLDNSDAVYVHTSPAKRYELCLKAIRKGKHVLCETPVGLNAEETESLYTAAKENGVILSEALRTAYSTAFKRLELLIKSGIIGEVTSLDAACTSLEVKERWYEDFSLGGGSTVNWGSYVIFAALKLLGKEIETAEFFTKKKDGIDYYTRMLLRTEKKIASLSVGTGIKTESSLTVSGSKGYVKVPSPWWKTDYFELHKEDAREDRRFYYPLEGEAIPYEIAEFIKLIRGKAVNRSVSEDESRIITEIISDFRSGKNVTEL